MGQDFEHHDRAVVDATPEQVWSAIATGPGIDSWFMGRTEVRPGEGGAVRTEFGASLPPSTITAWQPLERFAHDSGPGPDGRFIASEFLLEGRAGGSTVLRMVTSGFLPGDDWEGEYQAMTQGLGLFFRTLVEYLHHFAGRTATPVTAFGPPVADFEQAWALLDRALGVTRPLAAGDPVRFEPDGLPPVDAVVYYANDQTLGLRSADTLYRFMQGFGGSMIASHHSFAGAGRPATDQAWSAWLTRLYGGHQA